MSYPHRRFPRRPAGVALVTTTLAVGALTGGVASAQSVLTIPPPEYRVIVSAVDAAVRERATDPTRSLANLDRAREAFDQFAPKVGASALAGGIRDALQNARIAVGRSQTDLEAQAAQARGLLRKALHDSALAQLAAKSPDALNAVGTLANDFGYAGASRTGMMNAARAGRVDLVRALFERTATMKMNMALARVEPNARAQAFLETARANSWLVIVQDSPRATLKPSDFVTALSTLAQDDTATFQKQLADLRAKGRVFQQAAGQAVQAASRNAAATPTVPPEQTGTETPQPPADETQPTAPSTGSATAEPPATVPSAPVVGLDALYVPLSRALVAAGHGDNPAARRAMSDAARVAQSLPADVKASSEFAALQADIERVSGSTALRPADVRAVLGSLGNVEASRLAETTSALDAASAGVNRVWGGLLRALVFMLLGLFAVYPLYLLNLAFGGRNPYWRAIGVALLLLLLPMMLEGIASIGALVEGGTGLALFSALGNVSLFQQPLGQFVWALLALAAIGLAAWGFRGICMQFGLLGRRAAAETAPAAPVEWDEEV